LNFCGRQIAGTAYLRAECCDSCHGYSKVFYVEKARAVEPFADDLASLGLDLMVGEEAFRESPIPSCWLAMARTIDALLSRAMAAWNAGEHGVALDLWAPLAHQGVARAQSNMGAAFLEGIGVERDPDKAVAWLRLAAEQGDAGGQRNLALCHYEGWGVPQDHAEAARWYDRAAAQGDADSQDMLSWMKLVGGGVEIDHEGARRWAEQAAAQGKAAAMARLGDIHHNALGVARDPGKAASWWREAARRGHAEAQAMLGAAYLAGKGVTRDPVEALHWLLRAEGGGAGELAAGFLREARSHTKAAQRLEAERRAALPLD